jgi:hypothetical protein
MNDKKQTAVEWLVDQLEKYELYSKISFQCLKEIDQAKEMEKEQIIETWHNGYNNQSPMIDEDNCGQQYYKETYE